MKKYKSNITVSLELENISRLDNECVNLKKTRAGLLNIILENHFQKKNKSENQMKKVKI